MQSCSRGRRPESVRLLLASLLAISAAAGVNVPEIEAFTARARQYAELHKDLKEKLPDLKDRSEPERISAVQEALATALQHARRDARQGDLLSPDLRPHLIALVKTELKGAANTPARQSIHVGNPRTGEVKKPVPLKINTVYGTGVPLSSVPPSLLKRLPPLPEQLEYRFVGKHLILRDTVANIIVDYMLDVAP